MLQAWTHNFRTFDVHGSVHHNTNRKEPTRRDRVVEFIIPVFLNCSSCFERHTSHNQELKNSNCSLWFYIRLWLPAAVMAQPWQLPATTKVWKPEAAIRVFELLIMSCVSFETCWAIKKHWNNKFYYTVASCWLFLYELSDSCYYNEVLDFRQAGCIQRVFFTFFLGSTLWHTSW